MEIESVCHTLGPGFLFSETENSSVLSDKGRFSGSAGQLFSAGLLNFVQTIQKSTHWITTANPRTLFEPFFYCPFFLKISKMLRILLLLGVSYGQSQKRLPDAIIFGVRKGGTRALLEFVEINTKVSLL